MPQKSYSVFINSTPEQVWSVLWNDATYRQWTAVFAEGSCVKGDWVKGGKVVFGDGSGNGMVSRITEMQPFELMLFTHQGEVKDGVEDTTSEQVQQWAGAEEKYELQAADGGTQLTVTLDMSDEFIAMFDKVWPRALEIVGKLAEQPQ
jgi:uncharacterized protein YndB with AHSA1/START domain